LNHRPLWPRKGCYFFLDEKVPKTERSDLMNAFKNNL
jgi:hypothetical protein